MNVVYEDDDYCDCVTNVPNVHGQCVAHDQVDSTHIQDLLSKTKVNLKQPIIAKNAYEKDQEYGHFKLFFSDYMRDTMWDWTDFYLSRTGTYKQSKKDLNFLALEIAMGLRKNNNIKDYWSKKEFISDPYFCKCQSRRTHL